jgi:hypothetical protein
MSIFKLIWDIIKMFFTMISLTLILVAIRMHYGM